LDNYPTFRGIIDLFPLALLLLFDASTRCGASPALTVSKIENESGDAAGDENHDLAVEGLVSGFSAGSNSFKVSGQAVTTGSLSLAGIGNNVRVEVEGTLLNGVLVATKIKLDN